MNRFDLTFDKLFKIGLLILGVIFLFEFHSFNQKGRYRNLGDGDIRVFDTATGIVYAPRFRANDGMPGSVVFPKKELDLEPIPK